MKLVWRGIVFAIVSLTTTAHAVELKGTRWTIEIDPATLRTSAKLRSGKTVEISAGRKAEEVGKLKVEGVRAKWSLPSIDAVVSASLESDTLVIDYRTDETGIISWPITTASREASLVLPMSEGLCIPAGDLFWQKHLVEQGSLNTMADLSMPFWGIRSGEHTVTYILTNPFNSEIAFSKSDAGLTLTQSHEITRNSRYKTFGVRISLDDASPIASAKAYRAYLESKNQIFTLKQKIEKLPDVEKLLGAPHVYLWGDATISRHDVSDFRALMQQIIEQSRVAEPSMGKRIWDTAGEETRKLLTEQPTKDYVDDYTKRMVAEAICAVLDQADDSKAVKQQLCDAYPKLLNPIDTWGDGISPKMVRLLKEGGIDRMWLGTASYLSLAKHPEAATAAMEAGYLIGPYDSYHSIHSPDEVDTWETAQFDQALYETGPIVRADGTKKAGFKQKGFNLSPIAARPHVESRVNGLLQQFRCNSWFIDCDAFGEVFDDYSPLHPATQFDDMVARLSRMAWIGDTHKLVIGSEGGVSFASPVIAFAHGMMSPVIAWGDPDLYDKSSKSPYALGNYYPPDAPGVFFKTTKLKPEHRQIYFDPRFRVPLYQAALHDSVVATHHWSAPSFKFEGPTGDRELLELLYNVPPLYHLNVAEWNKRKQAILRHHAFFAPLHRVAGTLPMTDFRWLSADRLVQLTRFGDMLELVANFGNVPFDYGETTIPAHAILAIQGDKSTIYQVK